MTEQPIYRFLNYGADLAGVSAGCATEFLQAVPVGTGGLIGTGVTTVLKEFTARYFSPRERVRIAAATVVAVDRISARLINGHALRSDSFFDNVERRSSPSEELLEGVLLKARDSFEEKKVRHLGFFYANLVFTDCVSSETAHFLLKQLELLSYRQLCFIALVGKNCVLDVEPLRRPVHDDPEFEALKREEMDLHSSDLGTKGLIFGGGSWVDQLSTLGNVLYDLAGLKEIPDADKCAIEAVIESLRHSV